MNAWTMLGSSGKQQGSALSNVTADLLVTRPDAIETHIKQWVSTESNEQTGWWAGQLHIWITSIFFFFIIVTLILAW